MNITQAIILGLIQGLTEFLPISSSGHLVFIPKLLGWADQGLAFDVVVHMGTLLAVIVYFRPQLISMFGHLKNKCWPDVCIDEEAVQNRRVFWFIALSVIPAGIAGLWLGDWIEANTRATWIVGASLIFWGVMLGVADKFCLKIHKLTSNLESLGQQLTWKKVVLISFAQALALIPGTSRSGITMTAGLFSKLDRKSAAEFSFLISMPIIALAGFSQIFHVALDGGTGLTATAVLAGFVSSVVSGFFAIWILMKIIQRWSFIPFAAYRIIVGILILTLF